MDAFLESARKKAKLNTKPKNPSRKAIKKDKRGKSSKELSHDKPGTIYIGHLPHGFYEIQLRKYFSQFGHILKTRVARSRRTGLCKGYAFIQFASEEVAKIAAETMNNYMFFEKILKCHFIPAEKLKENTFRGWRLHMPYSYVKNRMRQNRPKTEERVKRNVVRRLRKLEKLKTDLLDQRIAFKFKTLAIGKS